MVSEDQIVNDIEEYKNTRITRADFYKLKQYSVNDQRLFNRIYKRKHPIVFFKLSR